MRPEFSSDPPIETFQSDFVLRFYMPENLKVDLVETHVRAYFGEKLLKPRDEKLWVGKDGTLAPDYVEMMQRSIDYWRKEGDLRAVERFEKELEGARNAVKLIVQSSERGSPLPVLINASEPGNFYVDKVGRKKSVTFVWTLESTASDGWNYHVFSLPTKHISLTEHWNLLKKLGNLQLTERILRQTFTELTAENLIAFPVILDSYSHNLDDIAKEMDYPNWDEVERIAANQLAMESDIYANERREKIVNDYTMRIFFAVKDHRERAYQEALVSAMSDTMAIEAGERDYEGFDAKRIEEEIDKNVRLSLALNYYVFEKRNYREVAELGIQLGDLRALREHYGWMQKSFATNPTSREARATGCGGSGMDFSSQFGWDALSSLQLQGVESLFIDQETNYSETLSITDSSSDDDDEPEGRYPHADYKPGYCRACNKDRKKVWHKSDGGCDCCTTCEHRLAGGD